MHSIKIMEYIVNFPDDAGELLLFSYRFSFVYSTLMFKMNFVIAITHHHL